jgi:dipeptidyl-peptidase-4
LTKIYWDSQVPPDWTGNHPDELRTISEKSSFTRTASHIETLDFISKLAWRSEFIHIERLFISDLRRISPLVILSNPRVTTPEEAKETGKPIIYLQGNIHPPEAEGKEALLMLMRDIATGDKSYYLDHMIILVAPDFNPDGTETWEVKNTSTFSGTPHIQSLRHNAVDADVNRDGIKMETVNMQGLYMNVLNKWDPVMTLDLHSMGRVQHGYCNLYAPSYVPTGYPGPREYTQYTVLPWIREYGEKQFGAMYHTHADFDWEKWPPEIWDPVAGGYSVEAKFIVNAIGLRNRMSILTETPGHVGFEKRIWACYTFTLCLLDYVMEKGDEIVRVCKEADEQVVSDVLMKAEMGELRNWVEGEYTEQAEKTSLYAYKGRVEEYIPGTSIIRHYIGKGEPELIKGVTDLTKPLGTKDAIVPRGYIFYEELKEVAEKLRDHGVTVTKLGEPVTVMGYEFIVDEFLEVEKGWIRLYEMTELKGGWFKTNKSYPAGSYHVDMAQPLANVAFYCLEPEVGDGLVGWNYFNGYLKSRGAETNSVVFPVFKYLKTL